MNNLTEIKTTGGANIGRVRMSWPFATLMVNKNKLELKASFMGSYIFTPSDIVSIEPAGLLFDSGGIRIVHSVDAYNKNIVFLASGASNLINSIRATGFLDNKTKTDAITLAEIIKARTNSGFPIRIPAIIGIVVIWNMLFFYDFRHFRYGDPKMAIGGIGLRLALGFIIITSILLLIVKPLQGMVLKPGRSVKDLRPFLYFIILICGIMLAGIFSIPVR